MLIISHRGNLDGPESCSENHSDSVDIAIENGYDVEIDLHYTNSAWYLGHDNPLEKITTEWLHQRGERLWIHCKNYKCLETLNKEHPNLNFFWHWKDLYTVTKKGTIWCLAGANTIYNSIAVLPEQEIGFNYQDFCSKNTLIKGICTDHPNLFAKILKKQGMTKKEDKN